REAVIEQMRNDVVIDVRQSGGGLALFSITYQGKDPDIVARVTNQLASDFIEWNLKSREQHAVGTTEFLNSQLQEAKKALEEQELVRRLNHVNESLIALPADKPSETAASPSTKPTATALRLEVISREMQRLKEEQRRIQGQITTYQAKVEAIPRREQEMVDLTRNYAISKARYESLLGKSYAADMSNELDSQE